MMKIAVLGAGILGSCTALELAKRGFQVDLFDKHAVPVTQASLGNEGKIHLGFVYANEPDSHTAKTLIVGAFYFSTLLKRWCDLSDLHQHLSTPFVYGVHTQSMLPEFAVQAHFQHIQTLYRDLHTSTHLKYLDLPGNFVFEQLSPQQTEAIFAPGQMVRAYRTIEHAIDTTWVADLLRQAVFDQPKINWFGNTWVEQATLLDNGKITVTVQQGEAQSDIPYDRVVNCLWEGRLQLDASMGIRSARRWLHRYKLGIYLQVRRAYPMIPSTTLILGCFGDVVNFQNHKFYFSWYPECMIGMSQELLPPDWMKTMTPERLDAIFTKSLSQLAAIHPVLHQMNSDDILDRTMRGGDIFAWGKTDIDDIASELHHRYNIGVHSVGNYHSVDTGKYTIAPYYAMEVCDRITG